MFKAYDKPKEYWGSIPHYCMISNGYKCTLRHYNTILETVTDTDRNAISYFNHKYGIDLKYK